MKTYEVSSYETWLRTVRVDAESPAEAIKQVFNLPIPTKGGDLEFFEDNLDLGKIWSDIPGCEIDELEKLGIDLDDDRIPSIHDVTEIGEPT